MPAKPRRNPSLLEVALGRLWKVLRWLVGQREGRLTLLTVVLLAALSAGPQLVWRRVGPQVLAGPEYQLTPEGIEIIPPPASVGWIRRDLKAEVVRDASLDRPLLILDDDLAHRVRQGFAMHPWIEKVHRVQKHYPARVTVEVVYRRPVAMVELQQGDQRQYIPVDRNGIVLPSEDFSPIEQRRFPHITEIATLPHGQGVRWADARVIGAARLAAAFGDAWSQLKLQRIVPSAQPDRSAAGDEEYTYDLWTRWGTRIRWGRPPGTAIPGEMTPEEKIARLLAYAKKHGSLDEPHDQHEFDLRLRGGEIIFR